MNIRPIKTAADHERAMAALTALMQEDPVPESEAADRLDVLATLIEKYEDEHFPLESPTPVEAIRFRMDQLSLKQKDLVPIMGSASRVSEVLNGKRSLSLSMIRALHEQLGIPARVLISDPDGIGTDASANTSTRASDYPLREMHQRGYFPDAPKKMQAFKAKASEHLHTFIKQSGVREIMPAYARSTAHYRSNKTIQPAAFEAWQARVLLLAAEQSRAPYQQGIVDYDFLEQIASLSVLDDGPVVAQDFLHKHGIAVVIEEHLPKTYLDGAALLDAQGRPVIGLTLRHDRLDNYWFTLLHELVHVGWHLDADHPAFFDVLDANDDSPQEQEADRIATETLISPDQWLESNLLFQHDAEHVQHLALQWHRHPAILAGRVQHETQNFRLLHQLVGRGQVRRLFEQG